MCQMSVASKIKNLQYLLGHESCIKQSNSNNNAEDEGGPVQIYDVRGALTYTNPWSLINNLCHIPRPETTNPFSMGGCKLKTHH